MKFGIGITITRFRNSTFGSKEASKDYKTAQCCYFYMTFCMWMSKTNGLTENHEVWYADKLKFFRDWSL